MRVLVVLPTYNEAATIENILERVRTALPEASILVVDDGSPDGTAKIAADVGGQARQRRGPFATRQDGARQRLPGRVRLGPRAGLRSASSRWTRIFSHDPDALPSLIAPLEEGYEVCIGSRYVPGGSIPNWSLARRCCRGAATSTRTPCSAWA